jgi:hypothetical protein
VRNSGGTIGPSEAYDGQWALDGGDLGMTLQVGQQLFALQWKSKSITGRAIGNPLFTRAR